jgi:hypothetical protein
VKGRERGWEYEETYGDFGQILDIRLGIHTGFSELEQPVLVQFCESVQVVLAFVWVGEAHYINHR